MAPAADAVRLVNSKHLQRLAGVQGQQLLPEAAQTQQQQQPYNSRKAA
jgi:hypothetical protein